MRCTLASRTDAVNRSMATLSSLRVISECVHGHLVDYIGYGGARAARPPNPTGPSLERGPSPHPLPSGLCTPMPRPRAAWKRHSVTSRLRAISATRSAQPRSPLHSRGRHYRRSGGHRWRHYRRSGGHQGADAAHLLCLPCALSHARSVKASSVNRQRCRATYQ